MNDVKIDRIGAKLAAALMRCIDELSTDDLCAVLAHAYRLLDARREAEP